MNSDETSRSLCEVLERLYSCQANLREVVGIDEQHNGEVLWRGTVYVFTLVGQPRATVAYAWRAPEGESPEPVNHIVLGIPPINSPMDAIRQAGSGLVP